MSIEAVENEVQAIRDRASGIQANVYAQLKEVKNDANFSEEGKRNRIAEISSAGEAALRELRDSEKAVLQKHIRSRETQLDAKVMSGQVSSDIIAFRDAQDRAERIEDHDEALKVMSRALRNRDTSLAHAIFRKAIDHNWKDTVDLFAEENPLSAEAARDLMDLNMAKENAWFQRGLIYATPRI